MRLQHKQAGYILVLTLMIVSISVILVAYVSNKAVTYVFLTKTAIDGEKAKALAYGGIQIAISQLMTASLKEEKKEQKDQEKKEEEIWQKKLLKAIVPSLNQWQEFKLTEKTDNSDGVIKICISCEDGKININNLYDMKEKKLVPAMKNLLQKLGFERIEQGGQTYNLITSFENFFKERQYKIQDVTELLKNKEFDHFKERVFFEPPSMQGEKKEEEKKTYLTDIFTVWNKKPTVEPWLLSHSLQLLLGFKSGGLIEDKKKMIEQLVEKFKVMTRWPEEWNEILAPLYGKEWNGVLDAMRPMMAPTFDPRVFSVLSYATVNAVTQRLLAIVERVSAPQDDRYQFHVKIRKVYWL